MKHITASFYLSVQFYARLNLIPDRHFEIHPQIKAQMSEDQLAAYAKQLSEPSQLGQPGSSAREYQDNHYDDAIPKHLSEQVWGYSQIREIVFDAQGKVKPLDELIFKQLASLMAEFHDIRKASFAANWEETQLAAAGTSCEVIKRLAKMHYHDICILSAQKVDSALHLKLKAWEGWDGKEFDHLFTFQLPDDSHTVDYEQYVGWQILYEEVCVNDAGVYEYGFLATKVGTMQQGKYQSKYAEVSIPFTSVEFKRADRQAE